MSTQIAVAKKRKLNPSGSPGTASHLAEALEFPAPAAFRSREPCSGSAWCRQQHRAFQPSGSLGPSGGATHLSGGVYSLDPKKLLAALPVLAADLDAQVPMDLVFFAAGCCRAFFELDFPSVPPAADLAAAVLLVRQTVEAAHGPTTTTVSCRPLKKKKGNLTAGVHIVCDTVVTLTELRSLVTAVRARGLEAVDPCPAQGRFATLRPNGCAKLVNCEACHLRRLWPNETLFCDPACFRGRLLDPKSVYRLVAVVDAQGGVDQGPFPRALELRLTCIVVQSTFSEPVVRGPNLAGPCHLLLDCVHAAFPFYHFLTHARFTVLARGVRIDRCRSNDPLYCPRHCQLAGRVHASNTVYFTLWVDQYRVAVELACYDSGCRQNQRGKGGGGVPLVSETKVVLPAPVAANVRKFLAQQ